MTKNRTTLADPVVRTEDTKEKSGRTGGFHPNVLLVRWEMATRARDWTAAIAIAKGLIAVLPTEPIGWIYHGFAQQQMRQLQEARQTLFVAARKFPNDWRIAYNLACYTAEVGDLAGAQNWLDRALEVGDPAVIEACAAKERSLKALLARKAPPANFLELLKKVACF